MIRVIENIALFKGTGLPRAARTKIELRNEIGKSIFLTGKPRDTQT